MNRRNFIWLGAGVAGLASVTWWQRNDLMRWALTRRVNEDVTLSDALTSDQELCWLTPEQVEGPYFIKAPVRRDIREDRTGIPLTLELQIVRDQSCRPVEGAVVEVWHCDAAGVYSGYPAELARKPMDTLLYLDGADTTATPTNASIFLRGAQVTNGGGMARFTTIFPGWYAPRVPHIHVKVFVEDTAYLTTQLYFRDDLAENIYSTHSDYSPHGTCPYKHTNDTVLAMNAQAEGLLLNPSENGGEMRASCRLGVA